MGIQSGKHRTRALWLLMLVLLAGAINTGGVLKYQQTVSHMTGNLTKLGVSLHGLEEDAVLLGGMLLSFILGSTLSGLAFPRHTAHQWKRCGVVLIACGLMLLTFDWLPLGDGVLVCVLCFTMGAQNGLAVRYRGILARTTHVTGHLTDCGAALGRMLLNSGQRVAELRLFLFHLSCVLSFLLGVVVAAWLNPRLKRSLGVDIMDLAALMYMAAGGLTWLMGHRELRYPAWVDAPGG